MAGARQGGCAGQGSAAKEQTYLAQGCWRAPKETSAHECHWTWMWHGHLGRHTCPICSQLHSTTAPAPARAPLIAIVGLATGWKNPAPRTPRASARRPGSGIQAQRLQLARGGARVPARCQRGADVVSWTPRLPSLGGEGLGSLLVSHLRGSFCPPPRVRPSYSVHLDVGDGERLLPDSK